MQRQRTHTGTTAWSTCSSAYTNTEYPAASPMPGIHHTSSLGAELEFDGDACDHPNREVDPKDLGPGPCRAVVMLVAGSEGDRLQPGDQQRQTHGRLREQIVERRRESEMQTVRCKGGFHVPITSSAACRTRWRTGLVPSTSNA